MQTHVLKSFISPFKGYFDRFDMDYDVICEMEEK